LARCSSHVTAWATRRLMHEMKIASTPGVVAVPSAFLAAEHRSKPAHPVRSPRAVGPLVAVPSRRRAGNVRGLSASLSSKMDLQPGTHPLHGFLRGRPECAKTGHSPTAWRTGQIDPERPFEVGPTNGRYAPHCGRRPNATDAPGPTVPKAASERVRSTRTGRCLGLTRKS